VTGNEAAEIVKEMCLDKQHQSNTFDNGYVVCDRCHEVMARLRELHRDNPPLPLPVLVHFVVDGDGTFQRTHVDQARANDHARDIGGLVVSMPASSDYRQEETDG
jgi:hypothetical protein